MGKNSYKNSSKEIVKTTVKIAGAIASIGAVILNAMGDSKK